MTQKIVIDSKDVKLLRELRERLPLKVTSYHSWVSGTISLSFWIAVISLLVYVPVSNKHTQIKIYSVIIQPQQLQSAISVSEEIITETKSKEDRKPILKISTEKTSLAKSDTNSFRNEQPSIITDNSDPNKSIRKKRKQQKETKETVLKAAVIASHIERLSLRPITPSSAVPLGSIKSNYWEKVSSIITENLQYPKIARMRGLEGETSVKIKINSEGKLINAMIVETSRSIFATAVLAATKSAAPFPPPPHQLPTPLIIKIPVSFRL